MKLCWDNIEKLRYNKKTGKWYKGKAPYVYKEKCKVCGEPYFTKYYSNSEFCSLNCSAKFNNSGEKNSNYGKYGDKNSFYGKHHTEETRKKLSETKKGENNYNYNKRGKEASCWKGGYFTKGIPTYDVYEPQIGWVDSVRRNKDDPNILEVECTHCKKWFVPKLSRVYNRIQSLKEQLKGESRFYCSEECKHACPLYHKSAQALMREDAIRAGRLPWIELEREVQPELREMVLERDDYQCVKCGSTEKLCCHHILPVATNPLESADVDNCMTLCYNCHKEVHQQPGCRYNEIRTEIC